MQQVQPGNPFGGQTTINDQSQANVQVQQQLASLEQIWRRIGVDNDRIYATFRDTILPHGRPLEVFLYPQPLATSRAQAPQSICSLAVLAAVSANQSDDLKQRLEARLGQPLGELTSRIALTQLALATQDLEAAGQHLSLINERIKLDSIQNTSDLACHAAIPAIEIPELRARAISILERATDHYDKNAQTTRNSVEEPIRSFRFKLAELHFQDGDVDAGKKHLAAWVTQLGSMWSNYSGDYPQYRRRNEYLTVAAMYARHAQRSDSLEMLQRYADITPTNEYGEQPIGLPGAVILYGIAQFSPEEQYQLLKAWSLPTADRRLVRVIGGLLPGDDAPPAFDAVRDTTPRFATATQLSSSADLLVRSAAAIGKLDELRAELEPFAKENIENAPFVLLLTRLAQSNDAKIGDDLRTWLNERRTADTEADKIPNNSRRLRLAALLPPMILAQAAVGRDETRQIGRELSSYALGRFQLNQDQPSIAFLRYMTRPAALGSEAPSETVRSPNRLNLKYWTGGVQSSASAENAGVAPMFWATHEGKLQHLCGSGTSALYFNYPLAGTFEVSCDVWSDSGYYGNAGYGGLTFDPFQSGQIYATGRRFQALSKPVSYANRIRIKRLSIRVSPTRIQSFADGTLLHEEPLAEASSSPWFMLSADRISQTTFSNIRIEGEPTIPSEVSLSSSPKLLGWSAEFYGENLPAQFKPDVAAPNRSNPLPVIEDWSVVNGEIRGRQVPSAALGKASVLQSRLQYGRPMRNGEQLDYEFWYEPGRGAIHVHPAFDRLAMLLEPDGVKLHWMTEFNENASFTKGLSLDNSIVDAASRRGPVAIPLMSKEWNKVQITLKDDTVALSLNGVLIFERSLESANNRQFGLYHDKHATSVRVRNVVLRGDWPKTLSKELQANLLAPSRVPTSAEPQSVSQLFDEKYEVSKVDHVINATRQLPPEDRYQTLKNWVLPNLDHAVVRMYADHTPSDPMPGISSVIAPVNLRGQKPANGTGDLKLTQRLRTGGDLVAPALDLIDVARELGKLPELTEAVQQIPDTNPLNRRSRLAMLALIAIASNDVVLAGTTLSEMTPPRDKGFSDDWPEHERWPELIVATEASQIPELRLPVMKLMDLVVDSVNRKGIGPAWETTVRSVRHRAAYLRETGGEIPIASARSPKGQWAQGTLSTAIDRSHGIVPRWRFDGNQASHLGGDGKDPLYYQSPLRGRFTVEGELSTFGWRESTAMYATHWAGPKYTLEAAGMGNLLTEWVGPKFAKKLEPMGDWYRFKLDVTPDKATWYANDELIHEQPLADGEDPWLAIHTPGNYAGVIRSVRILGEPEIPAELHLSKRSDLQGWWGAMYGDLNPNGNPAWKKDGEEIVATNIPAWKGRSRESLLQYHRPMLEDGEITYDFYYAPDQSLVHPAIGRMVLFLDPEGVKIHWLSDAQYERGGVSPGNLYVEPQHRRGDGKLNLKDNDWNQMSVRLRGDTVILGLNGGVIYERPLDAENQRTFGLFYFAGDTDVRVKNVVYRGEWPRTVPAADEQELARNDRALATFQEGELPDAWSWNFQAALPSRLRLSSALSTMKFSEVAEGLKITREPNSEPASDAAGLLWPESSIEGDFEVTLSYRDFQSTSKNENHQVPRIEIILGVGGGLGSEQQSHTLALTHRRRNDDKMYLTSILGICRKPAPEEFRSSDRMLVESEGQIRIVRRGKTAMYFYSPLNQQQWELLDQQPVADSPVKGLMFGLRSEDLMGTCSATLTEFSVRAKRIQ